MLATFRPMLAAAAVLATVASPSVSAPATPLHAPTTRPMLDHAAIARAHFGNDAPWYEHRIPFFQSADPRIDDVYYYRWSIFRAHQRDLGVRGYITTEFADDVSWQREPYASLNDASGFHIAEGRWLNDRRFTDDYINFMYEGGNDRHFTDYMADSVWGRYLVDGDRAAATRHLAVMRHIYGLWDDHYDFAKGLYFIEPLLDATEYTVSSIDASGGEDGFRGGDAFRPTINSYMAANARAISRIAGLAGDTALAHSFAVRADGLRARLLADLWNPALDHFADRYKADNQHVKYWEPIRARELAGYLPWMFDLVPDDPRYAGAWAHLLDPASLAGEAGMRTVEKTYPYYMRQYRYLGTARECQWNGPVWPYQTTQVLIAMANLLDHYGNTGPVTRSAYMHLLRQYTALHYQGGRLDLEEDYDPATGEPIVGLNRSHHYFHSGYIDLILSGLVGIRPRADDVLEVNPLLPASGDPQALAWFRAEDIPYHGHKIAVTWDADGTHYGRGTGLSIEVDGREAARRASPGRLTVPVTRIPNPPIARTINHAVQLVRGQFPMASASTNPDPEMLHDAIDGRLWFFPELPNGWTSAASNDPQWFEVNFGKPVNADTAELAFFDDGHSISVPVSVTIEGLSNHHWSVLAQARPLANGITRLTWPKRAVSRLKVRMKPAQGKPLRLVEFRAVSEFKAP
ncbi:MGH1-like glycoside hydrolase domain-containing protein [Novosphingobium naphthalenivorans]|uniref:MGH1-like glycoside hydrolase domain-containing protein n=1 Tax=Novosphingobium naphthalenivorans TaxID=273168 RepID=UPI00083393D3|nr:glycosyl hydrolase family 65 protein [Novosphingobium naphthalenivorans]